MVVLVLGIKNALKLQYASKGQKVALVFGCILIIKVLVIVRLGCKFGFFDK